MRRAARPSSRFRSPCSTRRGFGASITTPMFPKIYHKDRLAGAMRAARPGETPQQAWDRFMGDWRALQLSPFFPVWASATVDEILSALHERIVVGSLA